MNPILEIRDLEVTFRVGPMLRRQDIQAVAGVSFEVRPGETLRWSGKVAPARQLWPERPPDCSQSRTARSILMGSGSTGCRHLQ